MQFAPISIFIDLFLDWFFIFSPTLVSVSVGVYSSTVEYIIQQSACIVKGFCDQFPKLVKTKKPRTGCVRGFLES